MAKIKEFFQGLKKYQWVFYLLIVGLIIRFLAKTGDDYLLAIICFFLGVFGGNKFRGVKKNG